ncbi:hypothetical protein [Aerosakkonema funiforme]|uniref:hypothetical protein n=1 Tax=Aerosakkonema funiforme TaxID=1246630 RepID=UPI0035BBF2AD
MENYWEFSGKLEIFITGFGVIFPTILPLADHFFPTTFAQNSGAHQNLFPLPKNHHQMYLVKN